MAEMPGASSHLLEVSCLSFKSPVTIALGSILHPYFSQDADSYDAKLNPKSQRLHPEVYSCLCKSHRVKDDTSLDRVPASSCLGSFPSRMISQLPLRRREDRRIAGVGCSGSADLTSTHMHSTRTWSPGPKCRGYWAMCSSCVSTMKKMKWDSVNAYYGFSSIHICFNIKMLFSPSIFK